MIEQLDRFQGELLLRTVAGGAHPVDGDTLAFTKDGWRFVSPLYSGDDVAWGDLVDVPLTLAGFGLDTEVAGLISDHNNDYTGVHGIADTNDLALVSQLTIGGYTIPGFAIDPGAINAILYANSGGVLDSVSLGANHTLLRSTGPSGVPSWGLLSNNNVDAAAAIDWTKISKGGSSLADLTTKSASDLTSGNVPYARMPSGTGTWDVGAGNTLALTRLAQFTNGLVIGAISGVQGAIATGATNGISVHGRTGTSYDMVFLSPAGSPIWRVPTGTLNIVMMGGLEVDGSFDHDGTTVGFYNITPISRPAAYTQTYSTTTRTLAAYTSDTESVAYTGIDNAQAGTPYAKLTDLNTLRIAYENLRVFAENTAQMMNSVVDDFQLMGLLQ